MTNKPYLALKGVQELNMAIILAQKMGILTFISIIGLFKNISFTMLSNLGLFAPKHIGL